MLPIYLLIKINDTYKHDKINVILSCYDISQILYDFFKDIIVCINTPTNMADNQKYLIEKI